MNLDVAIAPPTPDTINLDNHPCFNRTACRSFGRIHLPVAPKCNILCNYCNRDFDCVNESRPGVTSSVLSPGQALVYLEKVMEKRDDIAVVGIAGPGDPFANAEETLETFRLVRARFPSMILCLSTNGLGLTEAYVRELADLKVSHVTLTINAVDPDIGGRIYAWVRNGKRILRGRAAAEVMIERQLAALDWIKSAGMIAKVNSIIVPGINNDHLPEVARRVSASGADVMNCIPLLPTHDTAFQDLPEPDRDMRINVRSQCNEHVSQMTHCARCRADAIGKLNEPMNGEMLVLIQRCAKLPLKPEQERRHVAVATREGMLVNQHLGEADELTIYGPDADDPNEAVEIEVRKAPSPGSNDRWSELGRILGDCQAILVSAVGPTPEKTLTASGLKVIQMEGLIETGLAHVFRGEPLPPTVQRRFEKCGQSCEGDGTGCG